MTILNTRVKSKVYSCHDNVVIDFEVHVRKRGTKRLKFSLVYLSPDKIWVSCATEYLYLSYQSLFSHCLVQKSYVNSADATLNLKKCFWLLIKVTFLAELMVNSKFYIFLGKYFYTHKWVLTYFRVMPNEIKLSTSRISTKTIHRKRKRLLGTVQRYHNALISH